MAAKKANAIVVLTESDKNNYLKELEISGEIRTIYNPVEKTPSIINYDDKSKTIITVGRLSPDKGFDMLVKVASKVFDKHNDWKWIIIGNGEEEPMIREEIKKNRLEENLFLLGKKENGQITECSERTGMWAWKHVHQADGSVDYIELKGDVVFDDVDFGYNPDKIVLHNVDLFATPGQKIAFVGSTGAGKTTITNLINRFYDIQDGKIRYDGININKIKKDDLRHSLGIVLQDHRNCNGKYPLRKTGCDRR